MTALILEHYNDEFVKLPMYTFYKQHGRWVDEVGQQLIVQLDDHRIKVKTKGLVQLDLSSRPTNGIPKWVRVIFDDETGGVTSIQEVVYHDFVEVETHDIDELQVSMHTEHSGFFRVKPNLLQ